MANSDAQSSPTGARLPWWVVAAIVTGAGLLLFWDQHRSHLLAALSWLLLIACPLLHFVMHRNHSHRSKGG